MQVTGSRRTVLVDECVPRRFTRALHDLQPVTVQDLGWSGTRNGQLLTRAAGEFDVLFTVDRDFADLSDQVQHDIGVVILEAGSTDYSVLLEHLEAVKQAIATARAGKVTRIRR